MRLRQLTHAGLVALVLLATSGSSGAVAAAAPEPPAASPAPLSLSRFTAKTGPLRLIDSEQSTDLYVPLAATAQIEDAVIDLRYSNSIALQPQRSVLAVLFNNTTLAQIRLDPNQPVGSARIRLPAELWRSGYNKLSFGVVQHYSDSCENPMAPELWTEIDLFHSSLSYRLKPGRAALTLADLDGLFSPGLGGHDRVLMMTGPEPVADRLRREALPLVAEALALRRQFAPLAFEHKVWQPDADVPNQDKLADLIDPDHPSVQVVVATPEQLGHILPATQQPLVDGPKLIVSNLGQGSARLIVTGRTIAEIITAAHNLSVMQDLLTPDPQVTFLSDGAKASASAMSGQFLAGGQTYRFDQLGLSNNVVTGSGANQVRISLPLPADFYTHESAHAELALDFSYGAGVGPGSILNILINGELIHGLALDQPGGSSFHDYRIRLPVRLMVPGSNVLDFNVNLQPQGGGSCAGFNARYLNFKVMGSSILTMPEAGHAAVLPDLARFASAGFPFVAPARTVNSQVIVGSPELIGSALTLMAKIAQQAHAPLIGWTIETGIPAQIAGDAILIATADKMPADIFREWAGAIGRSKTWPYRTLSQLQSLQETHNLTLGALQLGAEQPEAIPTPGDLSQNSVLGPLGVLATFRNPASTDASLIVLTAETNATLSSRVADLVQPELWGQMKGDLVAWDRLTAPMLTFTVGEHYQVGDQNRWLLLRLILSNNPWYWLAAVAVAASLLIGSAGLLVRRRRRKLDGGAHR